LTQPDPTQPNPWVNPTHGQLWGKYHMYFLKALHSLGISAINNEDRRL